MVAVICRDTRSLPLDDAQRLTHFPASPLMSLSWFQDVEVSLAARGDAQPATWQPVGAKVVVSGSQSLPTVCGRPRPGAPE